MCSVRFNVRKVLSKISLTVQSAKANQGQHFPPKLIFDRPMDHFQNNFCKLIKKKVEALLTIVKK